jgi:hypothetical protein
VIDIHFPQIQIRQQPAIMGIETEPGTQDIKQPKATMEMQIDQPKLEIRQQKGDLEIDQTRAWDALGQGPILAAMTRIYSQAKDEALRGIARIVENGNLMGDLRYKGNPIADIAQQSTLEHSEINYYGEASIGNVDIRYTMHKPEISVEEGKVNIYTRVNPPEIHYNNGKLHIYMKQYPKVEIIPPQIDLHL